jgi:hypothetical protein
MEREVKEENRKIERECVCVLRREVENDKVSVREREDE